VVVEAESRLLRAASISVEQVLFDNAEIHEGESMVSDARIAVGAAWSASAHRRVAEAVATMRPDIVHVHNTFTAASPSVYAAAASAGVPVVQTLHNYRFVCPSATAFRDGHPCTDCVGRPIAWPSVVHACVRGSHAQSLVTAGTMAFHRARRTYRAIRTYIALTEFQRQLMISGWLPASRIRVIPNFLEHDSGTGDDARDGILYVGRLSVEKGIDVLVEAAEAVPGSVTIVGDGPLSPVVEAARSRGGLAWLGALDRDAVAERLRSAEALLVPSVCFEGFPIVILEAFASGTPVIASRIGSLAELVDDGVNGLLVEPGNPGALRDAIMRIRERPHEARRMGAAAREQFISRYGSGRHLDALLEAYMMAMRPEARSA
jgi:glycosyltransferase involved in cell wall biosynthesis